MKTKQVIGQIALMKQIRVKCNNQDQFDDEIIFLLFLLF